MTDQSFTTTFTVDRTPAGLVDEDVRARLDRVRHRLGEPLVVGGELVEAAAVTACTFGRMRHREPGPERLEECRAHRLRDTTGALGGLRNERAIDAAHDAALAPVGLEHACKWAAPAA